MRGGYRPNSGRKKGSIPWNKGLKGIYSKETLNNMIKNNARKGKPGTMLGKYHSELIKKKCSNIKKKQYERGLKPWNKNLNKQNNKVLLKQSKQISKTLRSYYKKYPERHPNRNMVNISKPQRELYLLIKQYYPDAELEYPIQTKYSVRFADIAIPSLKIDIEYDGEFWHKNKQLDELRDKHLSEVGWVTIRFNKNNIKVQLNELKIK